ncbi:hypothetical protein [Marivita sp.]|uniref:hypothetical protein n=1 Tax=Marivita sp. TaxID=2003365 RepID=UPI003A85D541
MKTLICSITLFAAMSSTAAQADTWTWTPISNGSTLNAHLARCDFARPNPMTIFSTIAELQEKMVAPTGRSHAARGE